MKPLAALVPFLLLGASFAQELESAPAARVSWPSFRGPAGSGIAQGHALPSEWNVAKNENIRWKTELPGLCHSSPIAWGTRIFVTSAVREGEAELKVGYYGSVASVPDEGRHEFKLFCIDAASGKVLWERVAWKGVPKFKRHPKGSHAASTPATDGKHVAAFFGTEGLYVYTVDGELVWKKDLGDLDGGWYVDKSAQWGYGASPVIHDGRLIVQCDVQKDSFLACFDVATGEQQWRTPRDEVPTWSTPTVDVRDGRSQVICNGYKHIGGYDLKTGKALWWLRGGGDIPVPTPVIGNGLVYITNSHGRKQPILAISLAAEGELSMDADESEHVRWAWTRRGNYMQTPIVHGGELYCCNDLGVLRCIDAKTGEEIYRQRLGSGRTAFTASGVLADGKLYFPSEVGEVHVVAAGRAFRKLAVNDMGETCMASPAVAGDMLLLRTRRHLVAIAKR